MPDIRIGYHASHEQFAPSELLGLVQEAERAGFDAAMCSDHFAPWSERQGHSGYAWSWLGAALATTALSFGTVSAPGQRYHPAIVAQAAATLGELFPDRFWLALGSGEALNESITGERWPSKEEREARLIESVEVIRALFAGETVTHRGLVTVQEARLWTRPASPPKLIGAALTPETAHWVAGWADGLITVNQPGDAVREVVNAFRDGGGASKPMYLQVHLSYAASDDRAREAAFDQWRPNAVGGPALTDLRSPEAFDAMAGTVRPDDLDGPVRISSDPGRHVGWLEEDLELGFERLYLHQVGRDQHAFIRAFGADVLPRLHAVRAGEPAKVVIR